MKKLVLTVLALILCFALATPAAADIIIDPEHDFPPPAETLGPLVTEAVGASAEAAPASAGEPSVFPYLAVGVLVLAAAFTLRALLRRKKWTPSSSPVC